MNRAPIRASRTTVFTPFLNMAPRLWRLPECRLCGRQLPAAAYGCTPAGGLSSLGCTERAIASS